MGPETIGSGKLPSAPHHAALVGSESRASPEARGKGWWAGDDLPTSPFSRRARARLTGSSS
jgi:hypothetical protein